MDRVLLHENRRLACESMLEADIAAVLEARRDVASIREQWPRVTYRDDDGAVRDHTFDFHVTLATGRKVVVCVKPFAKLESSGLLKTLTLIKEQQRLRGLADGVLILTENDLKNGRAHNARQILRARRMRNVNEIEAARRAVSSLWGAVRFHDLLAGIDVPAHRRNAIWCLIDEGFLVPESDGRIDDRTFLRVRELERKAA